MLTYEHIRAGLHCLRLDKVYHEKHNIMTPEGAKVWLDVMATVKAGPRGSTVWFGTNW